ncbi:unnamed protein product, partial [marine sediment metagenome]
HSQEELDFALKRIDETYKEYEIKKNTKCPPMGSASP